VAAFLQIYDCQSDDSKGIRVSLHDKDMEHKRLDAKHRNEVGLITYMEQQLLMSSTSERNGTE
jgi:hypothetical protein